MCTLISIFQHFSFHVAFPVFKQNGGASNVPIRTCDSSSQLKYADLTTVHLSPHCDRRAQGFCGLHRNQNYTLMVKFSPKVSTKRLSVQVTTIDPTFGWETPLWPVSCRYLCLENISTLPIRHKKLSLCHQWHSRVLLLFLSKYRNPFANNMWISCCNLYYVVIGLACLDWLEAVILPFARFI